jgi:hypothetical protein
MMKDDAPSVVQAGATAQTNDDVDVRGKRQQRQVSRRSSFGIRSIPGMQPTTLA